MLLLFFTRFVKNLFRIIFIPRKKKGKQKSWQKHQFWRSGCMLLVTYFTVKRMHIAQYTNEHPVKPLNIYFDWYFTFSNYFEQRQVTHTQNINYICISLRYLRETYFASLKENNTDNKWPCIYVKYKYQNIRSNCKTRK